MNYGYDTIVENHNLNQTPEEPSLTFDKLWRRSKAVLFDFDGVIANSEPCYRSSWNSVLQAFGHSIPEDVYWWHWSFLGQGLEGEMERTGLAVPDIVRAKKRQREIYGRMCHEGSIPLFSGAVDALRSAMEFRRCAIASNTDSSLIRAIVEGKLPELPPVVGGEGLPPKPSPAIFLRAAETLGVEPSLCLVFEDADKGIRAAAGASMPSVLVRNDCNRSFPAGEACCEIPGIHCLADMIRELEC